MKYVEGARKLFMSTGTTFPREIIWSVALIKQLSAGANRSLGKLDPQTSEAIRAASAEVMDGKHDSEIDVDVFQTGSGTGINMNVNEVIAERASEISGTKDPPQRPREHGTVLERRRTDRYPRGGRRRSRTGRCFRA